MARTGGYRRSAVRRPCGVTPHAALQNKSVVCSGSRVIISTVMKLRWSVKRGGIIVKRIQRALAHIQYCWARSHNWILWSRWSTVARFSLVKTGNRTRFSRIYFIFIVILNVPSWAHVSSGKFNFLCFVYWWIIKIYLIWYWVNPGYRKVSRFRISSALTRLGGRCRRDRHWPAVSVTQPTDSFTTATPGSK